MCESLSRSMSFVSNRPEGSVQSDGPVVYDFSDAAFRPQPGPGYKVHASVGNVRLRRILWSRD